MVDKNKNGIPDDEEEAAPAKTGPMDWLWEKLNPSNWFSFGGIFKMLLVAIVGYFITKSETVQNWIGEHLGENAKKAVKGFVETVNGWVDKLKGGLGNLIPERMKVDAFNDMDRVETAKSKLKGTMPDAAYEIVTLNQKNWDDFHNTVKAANGGNIKALADITNSKSITKLMADQPVLTTSILKAVLNSPDKGMAGTMVASVKTMLSDGSFNTLLDDSHRKATISMLMQIIPADVLKKNNLDEKTLNNIIAADMKANNGTLSKSMQDMFAKNIDALAATPATTPDASTNSSSTKIDNTTVKIGLTAAMGEVNAPKLARLEKDLGPEKFQNVLTTLATQDPRKIKILFFQTGYADAFVRLAEGSQPGVVTNDDLRSGLQAIRSMSPAMRASVTALADRNIDASYDIPFYLGQTTFVSDANGKPTVEVPVTDQNGAPAPINPSHAVYKMMMLPATQQFMAKAGPENLANLMAATMPQHAGMFTKQNIESILAAGKMIANNPANKGNSNASQVVTAMSELIINSKPDAFKNLCAGDIMQVVNNKLTLVHVDGINPVTEFFTNDTNRNAFTMLLNGLHATGEEDKLLSVLRNHWDEGHKKGLVQILMDNDATHRLPKIMKNAKKEIGLMEGLFHSGVIGSNLDCLEALGSAMSTKTATTSTKPKAGPAAGI